MLQRLLLLGLLSGALFLGGCKSECAAACDKMAADCAKTTPENCADLCEATRSLTDSFSCGDQNDAFVSCVASATDKVSCGAGAPKSCEAKQRAVNLCTGAVTE